MASTELQTTDRRGAMVASVKEQMGMITDLMRGAMVEGQDFGTIPGTGSKPTLLKAGAEKLCVLFRLSTKIETKMHDMGNGHREYEVRVTLARRDEEGDFFGEGVGTCSTMESKYRWRNAQRKCPACGKAAIVRQKAEKGGGWICVGNDKGGCWAKFQADDPEVAGQMAGKVENPDPADVYNTVLKMAKKRALVDAVLTATAASQIFTQDLEDMHGQETDHEPPPARTAPPAEPVIDSKQKDTLAALSGRTPDYRLAQQTLMRHFRVKALKDIPARHYEEASLMLRNMVVTAPKTPQPTRNEDADVPEDVPEEIPM